MPAPRGPRKPPAVIIPGMVFGWLTALEPTPDMRAHSRQWRCLCKCGAMVDVTARRLSMKHKQSCGCRLPGEGAPRNDKTHGHCRVRVNLATPTYRSWRAMRNRCNPATTVKGYQKHYVSKGVKICDRWKHFEAFLADLGERPDGMTLDRFPDPAGNYEPENCRWATPTDQNNNKRKK